MEVLHKCCCGLDVHQAVVVACLLVGRAGKKVKKEVRKFPTVQAGLRELANWLEAAGCTLVAMESTGIYWMPVYEALEGKLALLVANAEHMRNLPGRKTDVGDSEWIADLARHGLLRGSFVPAKEFRELRDLTRYRHRLVETRATQHNRQLKYLEQCGIKLATFVTDMMGVSGRLMVQALGAGKLSTEQMAELAKGALRRKVGDLKLALDVSLSEEQRYLIRCHYQQIEQLDASIDALEERIAERAKPYAQTMDLLKTIPGISDVAAPAIIGEIGTDVSRFPTQGAFTSWIGVCPGNHESAGKRKHGRTRPGNVALKSLLVECAWAAIKADGYLRDKYYRLKARRGGKKAIMAIAHKLAIAIYQILRRREAYRDLGAGYLDARRAKPVAKRLIKRLEALGYSVTRPLPQQQPVPQPNVFNVKPNQSTGAKPATRTVVLKPRRTNSSAPAATSAPSNRAPRRRAKAQITEA